MLDLVIATKNKKKLDEIKKILADLNLNILSIADFDNFPEIQEDEETFEGNAIKKATFTAKLTGRMALADDSGLEIDYLNGKPGVRSARFAGENATDMDRNYKILKLLDGVKKDDRKARFKCAVAIANDGLHVFMGICEGEIAFEPMGDEGFGYDPIFLVPSYGKTFAQLGAEIKNQISHRAIALKKARELLLQYVNIKRSTKE